MSNKPFLILSIFAARDAVKSFPGKLNVISVERTVPVDASLCKNHIQIPIDDLDTDEETLGSPYRYCQKEDILKAVEFSKKHKVHIIHCHAGLSRSPAIAYSILRSRGMNKTSVLSLIKEMVPESEPNKRIVKLTDEIFG